MRARILFFLIALALILSACGGAAPEAESPATEAPAATEAPTRENILNIVRLSPPALIQFSESLAPLRELPLALPSECGLSDIFSPPYGSTLAIELSCAYGPSLLFLNVDSGAVSQAFPNADSHFLAWSTDSQSVYLRVDSFNAPRIIRVDVDSLTIQEIPISEFAYDLVANPLTPEIAFTVSNGYGLGSELNLTNAEGQNQRLLLQDKVNYISFLRWSPDGSQLAFIKIPDSQIPFTVGELWTINSDGTNPRKLSDADAGHGYAANWSPDGKQIALVIRLNSQDSEADYNASALISDIKVVNAVDGSIAYQSQIQDALLATPHWSPDGTRLFFQREVNGRIEILTADLSANTITPLITQPACCVSWMKR